LTDTNTLAYYENSQITDVKSFKTLGQGVLEKSADVIGDYWIELIKISETVGKAKPWQKTKTFCPTLALINNSTNLCQKPILPFMEPFSRRK
jgi:hypothetical protein